MVDGNKNSFIVTELIRDGGLKRTKKCMGLYGQLKRPYRLPITLY